MEPSTVTGIHAKLAELVKRRDDSQDALMAALLDVDAITKRIDVLIDRYCTALDDGR